MNVNVWDVIDQVKPLITAGNQIDTGQLANPDVSYTSLGLAAGEAQLL